MALNFNFKNLIDIKEGSVYHKNQMVIEGIDFQLAEAEFVYLIGKSGSGKSSFIKSLYALNPVSGKKFNVVDIDMLNLKKNEVSGLRKKMGIVFQEFHLFQEWTIFQNLEFVLKVTDWVDQKQMEQRIAQVLSEVNLDNVDPQMKVNELSGGQKQKLAIARALLNKPSIIIADEATGNLDPSSSREILNLLHRISAEHKTSILFATHDQSLMNDYPARTIICEGNRLIAN